MQSKIISKGATETNSKRIMTLRMLEISWYVSGSSMLRETLISLVEISIQKVNKECWEHLWNAIDFCNWETSTSLNMNCAICMCVFQLTSPYQIISMSVNRMEHENPLCLFFLSEQKLWPCHIYRKLIYLGKFNTALLARTAALVYILETIER